MHDKVLRNERVLVPITNEELRVAYAFQNGLLNLVRPLQITQNTLEEAQKLAVDGDLMRKHVRSMEKPAVLLIAIACADNDTQRDARDTAERLLQEYELKTYREENIDDLQRYAETALFNHG
jgi:hypothetical protein